MYSFPSLIERGREPIWMILLLERRESSISGRYASAVLSLSNLKDLSPSLSSTMALVVFLFISSLRRRLLNPKDEAKFLRNSPSSSFPIDPTKETSPPKREALTATLKGAPPTLETPSMTSINISPTERIIAPLCYQIFSRETKSMKSITKYING